MINPFFYDSNLNVYKNHVDAIKSNNFCWIYYFDDFYKTVNWKSVSELPLEVLYKLRAQEIRDTYEYVILCLSGGIDSRTVFESFYKNNIHIDEIVCVGAYSQDEFFGSEENNNDEIYINVKNMLNECNLPKTKIKFEDYTKYFNKFSLLKDYKNDWIFNIACWKSIHNYFWYDAPKYLVNHNKKTCLLFGTGKTQIFLEPTLCVKFHESDIFGYWYKYKEDNVYRENFYFGQTQIAADIIKKQALIMYEIYKKMEDKLLFYKNYNKLYNRVIYDHTLLKKQTRKSSNNFLSVRDKYILRHKNSDLYKIYHDGLVALNKQIGLNCPLHTTRPYFLLENT